MGALTQFSEERCRLSRGRLAGVCRGLVEGGRGDGCSHGDSSPWTPSVNAGESGKLGVQSRGTQPNERGR